MRIGRQHIRDCQRRGHTVLELLLVLSITAVVTGSGMQLLHTLLWRQQVTISKGAESAQYMYYVTTVQSAFNKRCMDPFSREPWLVLETDEGDGWYALRRISLSVVENGKATKWIWESPESVLILVNLPSGEYLNNQMMPRMRFKFPRSAVTILREGIAIEGIRETVLLNE